MDDKKIDIDKAIDKTQADLIKVLNESGLTSGIMILMLENILNILRMQKAEKYAKSEEGINGNQ